MSVGNNFSLGTGDSVGYIWVEVTSPTPLCTDFNITSFVIPMPSLSRDVLAHAQRSGKIEKHVVDLVLGI